MSAVPGRPQDTSPARVPRVVVLGGGSWGTTVASILARSAPTVLWARSAEVVADVVGGSRNSRYLGDARLHPGLTATASLPDAVRDADVLVMAVPSHAFRQVLEDIRAHVRPWIPVVSLVKGLEEGTGMRMTQIVAQVLPGHPAGVLAGPNIAREVLAGQAAAATIAMPDQNLSATLRELFRTPRFRIYSTTDVVGVEAAGALKNVYAIAAGMGDGAGAGDNTRAMVLTRALREMTLLGMAMGGERETFAGMAGMGDLFVTCSSPHSRNRHVGEMLGQGMTVAEILRGMTQVAEGVKAAPVAMKLAADLGVQLPIASEVDAVVRGEATVNTAYRGLLAVAPGHEVMGEAW